MKKMTTKDGQPSQAAMFKQRWKKQIIPGLCRLKDCAELAPGKARYCVKHQAELVKLTNIQGYKTYRKNLAAGNIAKRYVDAKGMPTPYAVTKVRNAVRLLRAGHFKPMPARGPEASAYLAKLAKLAQEQGELE
jgi:hypothetical protein